MKLVVGVLAVVLGGGVAVAAPMLDPHVGGVVLVGPTAAHPTATFYNPAALVKLRGHHLFFQTGGRLDRTSVARDSFDPATGEAPGSQDVGEVSTNGWSPAGYVALLSDLNSERYRVGASLYAPFTERLGEGGDALAAHERGGGLGAQYLTFSAAIRGNGMISFGAGLSFVWTQFALKWRRDLGLEACASPPCTVEDPALAQDIDVDSGFEVTPTALSFNFGVLFTPWPDLQLGVTYVSFPTTLGQRALSHGGSVEAHDADGEIFGRSQTTFRLPQMVLGGLRFRLRDDTDLVFGFRWIDLSTHDRIEVRLWGPEVYTAGMPEWITRYRGLVDVVSLDGGLEHVWSDKVRLGTALRFETSGVDRHRVAAHQVDGNKVELAAGAELALSPSWALTLGYAFTYMLPVDTGDSAYTPSALEACREASFDLDVCTPVREGRAVPTAEGTYDRMTHQLTLGVDYQWF